MSEKVAVKDDLVSNDIIDLLKKQLSEDGVEDFTITIAPGSVKGDNYLGIIAKATVEGKKNGKLLKLDFIIKSAPKAEGFRSLAPIRKAYETEIYMYSVVLPTYMKFQEERNVKSPFTSFAKCLKTSFVDKDEALIMEDMKTKGYVMQNRHLPLNYDHVTLVVKQLAKLHAFSFAMKDQEPELFEKISEKLIVNFFEAMDIEKFDQHADMIADKARVSLDPVKDAEALERYNKYSKTINEDTRYLLSAKAAGEHAVIRHADCWTNNFLFYYENEDHKSPTKVCFLDWQISCLGSPVLDLLYFLYSCSDGKTLNNHFYEILKTYHNQLIEFGFELGTDINKLFSFDNLMEHMHKFGKYGLAIATMLIHLMTSEADEVPDMSEVFEDGNDFIDAFQFKSKNEDYYHKRIRDVVLHQVKMNFI